MATLRAGAEIPTEERPQRTCVACRRTRSKPELVRLVAVDSRVSVDVRGKARGRGAYLCAEPSCFTLAERRRALDRALRVTLSGEDWQRLRAGILG